MPPIASPRTRSTARPLPGRPVKIDLQSLIHRATPAAVDAPEPIASAPTGGEFMPLSDMVDRAAAQVMVLRKAVEDAAVADRIVKKNQQELAQRIAQGEHFAADLDQRLARAGKAAEVVEKASGALRAMEDMITQVRAAQDSAGRSFEAAVRALESKLRQHEHAMETRIAHMRATTDAELAEQRESFERTLMDRAAFTEAAIEQREREFEQRLEAHREHAERRIADLSAGFERAMAAAGVQGTAVREEFEKILHERQSEVKREAEQICAAADRYVAQAQARASLILDGLADRMQTLSTKPLEPIRTLHAGL